MSKRIHLPGSVHLLGPDDEFYPLSKQAAGGGKHALHIGDPTGRGGTIVGTLDELAVHVGEAASVIFQARAALRGEADPPDDRAIVIDRERLTEWAKVWSEHEYGSWGFVGAAADVVNLVTDLNDGDPDETGWRTRAEVAGVTATATEDSAVVASLGLTAGFRLSTTPQEDLAKLDAWGGDLAVEVAERIAELLNESWAAYRAAR